MFDFPVNQTTGAGAWLRSARDRLEAEGINTASLDARMLLLDGLALPHSVIVADPNLALNPEEIEQLEAMLSRRLAREPVSRILGWREFYGHRFSVTPDVLDPRADTEVLVDTALRKIGETFGPDHPCRFLDIGTGSGCIAISLLCEKPAWSGWASDISEAALKVARKNAGAQKVLDRLKLVRGSWAAGQDGPFDLVVSNPPYISTAEMENLMPEVGNHDPELALWAGEDGLDAYREILKVARGLLSPGGMLMLEIGATQAATVMSMAFDCAVVESTDAVEEVRDLAGHTRVLVFQPEPGKA